MMLNFSKKQLKLWENTVGAYHRWNISIGAARGGKTYLDYFRIPHRIRGAGQEGLILLLGHTRGTLERNILAPMRKIWGRDLVGRVNNNGRMMLFGRECHALGADKSSQVARLQGAGLSYCYGDEITTWHPSVFHMLKSRLDKPGARFDGTCNPDNPRHWFKKFLDETDKNNLDIYVEEFCIDDNPFLEPAFVDSLKREYAGTVYYDRLILGRWTAAEGRVYAPFSREKHIAGRDFLRDAVKSEPFVMFAMGADIGGNKSATAFTLIGITQGFGKLVALDEVYDKSNKSAEYTVWLFSETVKRWRCEFPRLADCYTDSAEQLFIKSFRRAAPGINVRNARKSPVNDRIRAVNRLLAQDRLFISDNCPELIHAVESAVWDPREKTKDSRLDDGVMNVDSLDSFEYASEPFFAGLLKI